MLPQVTLSKYLKSFVFYHIFQLGNAFLFLRRKIKAKAPFHKYCAGPNINSDMQERQIVSFYNSNTSIRNSKDMNRKI